MKKLGQKTHGTSCRRISHKELAVHGVEAGGGGRRWNRFTQRCACDQAANSHTFWREATLLQVVSEMPRLYYPLLRVLSSMSRLSLLHVWKGTGSIFSLVLLGMGWRGQGNSSWGVDRLKGGVRAPPILSMLGQKYSTFMPECSQESWHRQSIYSLVCDDSYMYECTLWTSTCTLWPGEAVSVVHVLHDLARLSLSYINSMTWWNCLSHTVHLLHDLARLSLSYMYWMTWRGWLSHTCTPWPGKAGSLIHILYSMTWRGWPAGWLWAPWALSPSPAASVQGCKLTLQTWDQ